MGGNARIGLVPLTPRIRDFLVELEDLIERSDSPGLDHERTTVNTAHAVALVRLPHATGAERDVELEVAGARLEALRGAGAARVKSPRSRPCDAAHDRPCGRVTRD